MKFSEEQRRKAAAQVATYGPHEFNVEKYVYPDGKTGIEIHSDAVELQCQRNAAVELLQRATPLLDETVCYASTTSEHAPNLVIKDVCDFLSAFPVAEGEPK